MVHRSKRKVRPSGQEKASSIEGTVSEIENFVVISECEPTAFQTIQDNLCTVVREEWITIFPPNNPDRKVEIKSGDIYYNIDYKTVVEYTLENGKWVWASAYLGKDRKLVNKNTVWRWNSVYRAIFSGELVPVKNRELVTLSFLTGKNHIKVTIEQKKETECN